MLETRDLSGIYGVKPGRFFCLICYHLLLMLIFEQKLLTTYRVITLCAMFLTADKIGREYIIRRIVMCEIPYTKLSEKTISIKIDIIIKLLQGK